MHRLFLIAIFSLISNFLLAQVSFLDTAINVGALKTENGIQSVEFNFINNGSNPLKIMDVKASCGCTVPEWSKSPIAIGDTGMIVANFNPNAVHPGEFVKQLQVYFEDMPMPQNLYFVGSVEKVYAKPAGFKKYFNYDKKMVRQEQMVAFADSLVLYWSMGKTLKIQIEGSASFVPTYQFKSNDQLALKRAKDMERDLRNYLESKGVNGYEIVIHNSSKVQGPKYIGDYQNTDKYGPYQYVAVTVQ